MGVQKKNQPVHQVLTPLIIPIISQRHTFSTAFYFLVQSLCRLKQLLNQILFCLSTLTDSPELTFQHFNLKPSYYKVGDFPDEASARSAFDNLNTFDVSQWLDMADPVLPNQVWIYRSGTEHYAKIRIISTINETRQTVAYGECTFQWVYQPDGSLTFPGK